MQPLARVSVAAGLPALYWTSHAAAANDATRSARVVAAANNAGGAWRGTLRVAVDDLPAAAGAGCTGGVACEDVRSGASLACSVDADDAAAAGVLVPLTIDAYDVAVLRVTCEA